MFTTQKTHKEVMNMTQQKKQADKIALLNASFVMLDEHNQDYILAVLQTLKYAQNRKKDNEVEETSTSNRS